MGYAVKCRSCDGLGKKWVNIAPRPGSIFGSTREYPCRACDGSGINRKFLATRCDRCREEIIYPTDAQYEPKYCKSCKADVKAERDAKWREKSCSGCGTTIKYNTNWDKIPDLCPSCKDKKRREREEAKAKWKEKTCSGCGATIKYHEDWNKIPDLCKACVEKKKQERAAREANMRKKLCPGSNPGVGCPFHNTIRWDESKRPGGYPLCKQCSDRKRANWATQSENNHAFVQVKGDKGDDRTDIIVTDKSTRLHKHFSYDGKSGDESDWHDWKK